MQSAGRTTASPRDCRCLRPQQNVRLGALEAWRVVVPDEMMGWYYDRCGAGRLRHGEHIGSRLLACKDLLVPGPPRRRQRAREMLCDSRSKRSRRPPELADVTHNDIAVELALLVAIDVLLLVKAILEDRRQSTGKLEPVCNGL